MLSDVEEINQSFFRYATGILAQAVVKIKYIHDISMGDVQCIVEASHEKPLKCISFVKF